MKPNQIILIVLPAVLIGASASAQALRTPWAAVADLLERRSSITA
jgi:hypothetical protein